MDSRQNAKGEDIHNIIIENRGKISVSGVEDIESFNEEEIILHTCRGVLFIKGENLHINRLSVDSGDTQIMGNINSLDYPSNYGKSKGAGFVGRLFR